MIALISPTPRALSRFLRFGSLALIYKLRRTKIPSATPRPPPRQRAAPGPLVKCRFDTPFGLRERPRFDTSEALLNDRWSLSEVEVPVAE